ncbi:formylglycine-generating enzyme family protein [candidate division KSB1 bacterium]|nr:formylglycine-generating enzyme family protein [candidate division KSB1 bacterium]
MNHIRKMCVVWGILVFYCIYGTTLGAAQTDSTVVEDSTTTAADTSVVVNVDSSAITAPDSSLFVQPETEFFTADTAAVMKMKISYLQYPPRFVINNNDDYCKSADVTLTVDSPHALFIKISNDENFKDAEWGDALTEYKWKLEPGDGDKEVYLKAYYPDSTESITVSDDIKLVEHAPVPLFDVIPDSGIAGETEFIVDATRSEHPYEIFFRWDWENDGRYDTYWSLSRKEKHVYSEGGGVKTITLEVKDTAGWRVVTSKDILVYSRPKASFEVIQKFENPYEITLDATASTDFEDGGDIMLRWTFSGDSLMNTDWTFDKLITRNMSDFQEMKVVLEVKDSDGITNRFERVIENLFRDMVFIPASDFMMGSEAFEMDESPRHNVFIDEYWIDKYPVTNKQFAAFLNATQPAQAVALIDLASSDTKIMRSDSTYFVQPGYEEFPVVQVTWYGANQFVEYHNKKLPTEAEWEKAARGSDGRLYPWGEKLLPERANYWDSGDPFDNNPTPVGFYNGRIYDDYQTVDSPSPFGVYDLVGNVREWCSDWYEWNYYSNSPLKNPTGPKNGTERIARGGGYLFHADKLRATFRSSFSPETSNSYTGFRCVIRPNR